jgi:hypothetical protein
MLFISGFFAPAFMDFFQFLTEIGEEEFILVFVAVKVEVHT